MSNIFNSNTYKRARGFIYRNSRPLTLALWQYHFEGGTKAEVIRILSYYQNIDGGFAYGLEADSFNPNSSPIQTWCALGILQSLGDIDVQSPMVNSVLYYLENSPSFDGDFWIPVVPSNNCYPHAPWWHYNENYAPNYNPTASLAGFYVAYGDKDSKFYSKALKIAKTAIKHFLALENVENHLLNCIIELYNYVKGIIELPANFESQLNYHITKNIEHDVSLWGNYVAKPSMYLKNNQFYKGNEDIVKKECDYIIASQLESGAWNTTWYWDNYPEYFEISKLYWQGEITLINILFLKNFCEA